MTPEPGGGWIWAPLILSAVSSYGTVRIVVPIGSRISMWSCSMQIIQSSNSVNVSGQGSYPTTVSISGAARWVVVFLVGTNYLSLAEVKVWGTSGNGPQNVSWTSTVDVSPSGNSLTKNGGVGWDAGAVSTQAIASGDGYVEFTASETNTYRMLGLSHGDSNQDYTDIDFAFYPAEGGGLHVYESGQYRGRLEAMRDIERG